MLQWVAGLPFAPALGIGRRIATAVFAKRLLAFLPVPSDSPPAFCTVFTTSDAEEGPMSQSTGRPRTVAQMVAEARARIESLTPEQVAHEMDHGALLVDLREGDERAQHGIIAGSIHAPRGMLEFWADPASAYHRAEFDPSLRIILHCASGGRSALAADRLQEMGYQNVAHLEGGMKAWKESGRGSDPLEASPPATPQA